MLTTSGRRVLAASVAALLWYAGDSAFAQTPPGTSVSIALGPGASQADVAALDARITAMVDDGTLVLRSVTPDPSSGVRQHEYFAQVHHGIHVLGGGISRQTIGNATVSAFGVIYTGITLPPSPALTAARALAVVEQQLVSRLAPDAAPDLIVLPELDGTYRFVYRATFGDGMVRYVDANTGTVVRTEPVFISQSAVGSGTGFHGDRKKISASRTASGFETRDEMRPAPIITRTVQGSSLPQQSLFAGAGTVGADSDNNWANPALVDAHVNAGLAVDYFAQRQGWPGIDGLGGSVNQVVADRATIDTNAFFFPATGSPSTAFLAYGVTGSGVPMTPLDVVGHELMHGVTFFSVRRRTGQGLSGAPMLDGVGPSTVTFGNQSLPCATSIVTFSDGTRAPFFCVGGQYALASSHGGALNEGFSDVFGTAVEFFHQPAGSGPLRADYVNAEDALLNSRVLSDPALVAVESTGTIRYPDHYERRLRYTVIVVGSNLLDLMPYAISGTRLIPVALDDGGVHFNATIMGHAFYLAIEGGQNRTSGLTVQGVGAANRHQIERIFFRAMTTLMPSGATFPIAAATLRQSAVDLFGSGSAAFRAIDQALTAVGL